MQFRRAVFLCSTIPMRILLTALLAARMFAASISIDAGSPNDKYFTGGSAFTFAGTGDTTLRISSCSPNCVTATPFTYKIPVDPDGPYIVTLRFIEPSNTGIARAFAVAVNDQVVMPRVTMPGFMQQFSRALLAWSSDGFITIRFDAITRSAVVQSIDVAPFVISQYIVPADPRRQVVSDAVPSWLDDGQGYSVPNPQGQAWNMAGATFENISVYRNGLRGPVNVTSKATALRFLPLDGQRWPDTDTVVVDYTAVLPPEFVPLAGLGVILRNCARCHGADVRPGSGPGGLDLRTREAMLAGGSRGPALVPGDPDASLIYRFASKKQWPYLSDAETIAAETSNDDALGMPPFHMLGPWKVGAIRAWIAAGAPVMGIAQVMR